MPNDPIALEAAHQLFNERGPRQIPLFRAIDDCLRKMEGARTAVRNYTEEIVSVGHASDATCKALLDALLGGVEFVNWLALANRDAHLCDGGLTCIRFDAVTNGLAFDDEREDVYLMGELTRLLLYRQLA